MRPYPIPSRGGIVEALVRRLAAPLGLLAALPALAAAAQKPDQGVDPRAAEAKTACAAGEVQKGVRLLAELYTATDDPTWIFNQGRCYQQNGHPAQALPRFKEYLRKSQNEPAEDRQAAQQHIKELEAELAAQPRTGAADGPEPAGGLSASGASGEATPAGRLNRLQVTGIALGGVGVLSIATGVFFSIKVQSTEKDVNKLITGQTVVEAGSLKDRDRSGARFELLQWISYGVGVAAVAAGATSFFLGAGRRDERGGVALSVSPVLGPGVVGSTMGVSF
jgi:hypothetical protein